MEPDCGIKYESGGDVGLALHAAFLVAALHGIKLLQESRDDIFGLRHGQLF